MEDIRCRGCLEDCGFVGPCNECPDERHAHDMTNTYWHPKNKEDFNAEDA
jgi:hypothetical protein